MGILWPDGSIVNRSESSVLPRSACGRGKFQNGSTGPGDRVVGRPRSTTQEAAPAPSARRTTISQDAPAQAAAAVATALERLDIGREPGAEVVIRPRLVVCGTTAPSFS